MLAYFEGEWSFSKPTFVCRWVVCFITVTLDLKKPKTQKQKIEGITALLTQALLMAIY